MYGDDQFERGYRPNGMSDDQKNDVVNARMDSFLDGMTPRPDLVMPDGVLLEDYLAAKELVESVENPE